MKTIFLAAGRSSRLNPLGDKNLLSFCGKPFIVHLLENAVRGGLNDFIIVCSAENKNLIEKALLLNTSFSYTLTVQKNIEEGMAGGVSAGLELVDDSDSVFVLGGNDYMDPSIYKEIIKSCGDIDGGLLAKKVDSYFPGGYLEVNNENKIHRIIEKPGEGNEPSTLVNIVAHYFKKSQDLKEVLITSSSSKDDVYEVALQSLFETKNFKAVEYTGEWKTIKYPWHVLDMMTVFLSQQKNFTADTALIADTARIRGEGVYISEGVKVFDNAVISGPCFIGKNTVVGNNALVRECSIGENCTIGYNSEVARSFWSHSVQAHIAYVGDSVVDESVNFGAFSSTANLRLDQKNIKVSIKEDRIDSKRQKLGVIVGAQAQIGTHVMMMPGSKIDKGALVPPGALWK